MRVISPWPRLLLLALCVAIAMIGASPAPARVRMATFDELRREPSSGDFISLVQTTGDVVEGRLRRFGDTDLEIQAETRQAPGQQRRLLDVRVPLSSIQSLERPRDSVRNGALIGAGVGGGFVLANFLYLYSVDCNETDEVLANLPEPLRRQVAGDGVTGCQDVERESWLEGEENA